MLLLPTFLVLAAVQSVPKRIPDLYRPGEERAWTFELDGERIGHHAFRYEGPVDALGARGHRFTGRVRLDAAAGLPDQRFTGELVTDDEGRPLRAILEAQLGDARSSVEIAFDAGKASAVVRQGREPKEIAFEAPRETFLQANNFVGYHELLVALAPRAEDGSIRARVVSANALQVVPYEAKASGERLEDSLGETIELDGGTRIREIAVAAQKLRIAATDERFEPFALAAPRTRERPADFDVAEITVRRGAVVTIETLPVQKGFHPEAVLRGELTRPKGAQGPLPAVLFLSGSGLQDRDGVSSGIDLGTHEILDHLTRAGFAVMRMDDRGAGESTGPLENLSYEEIVADQRACLDHLISRPDVDPRRVALIGHSEGGVTAPILAFEKPVVAAVVLMAAPARPLADLIVEQTDRELARAGKDAGARAEAAAALRKTLALAVGGGAIDPATVPEDHRPFLSMRAWLRGHARFDPLANVARLSCPVLLLQGAKDVQVSAEKDARALARALADAKHADHELVVFPHLDHLFKRVAGEESTTAQYFADRRVDPEFLETLTSWLSKRLK